MSLKRYAAAMEALYRRVNRPEFIGDDPVAFPRRCADMLDREIVALVSAVLAYGRVAQIRRSVSQVLDRLGPRPAQYLSRTGAGRLRRDLADFRHRFSDGPALAALLDGARKLVERHGSLEACFALGLRGDDETVLPALESFVARMNQASGGRCGHLLPSPSRRSACKRLNLMLRWLVRCDAVDPGGWRSVRPSMLLVPLDVHMHRIAQRLGATRRRAADMTTVIEVTAAFRDIRPDDPVRYDFALTRMGICNGMDLPPSLRRLEG